MRNTKEKILSRNKQLKLELNNFSTFSSWEAIARNNLKMAGENEILIIIDDSNVANTQPTSNTKTESKKNGKHN